MSVPRIVASSGVVHMVAMTDSFTSHCEGLYTLKMTHTSDELSAYLSPVDFPVLTDMYRDCLDSTITLKEVQVVISSLQTGKTPGPDRFPIEFIKHMG